MTYGLTSLWIVAAIVMGVLLMQLNSPLVISILLVTFPLISYDCHVHYTLAHLYLRKTKSSKAMFVLNPIVYLLLMTLIHIYPSGG